MTSGFPVELNSTLKASTIRDYILKEGVFLTSGRFSSNTNIVRLPTIATVNTSLLGGTYTVPLGKVLWLQGITVSADRPLRISGRINQGQHQGSTFLNGTSELFGGTCGKFAHEWQISCDKLLFEGAQITFTLSSLEPGQEPPLIELFISGMEATNDLNYTAKNTILVAGDSITSWGLGNDPDGYPYCGKDLYASRLANRLATMGYSTRVVNKGIRGSTSREGRYGLIGGFYDGIDYDLLIIGYGTNDAAANVIPTAEVKTNIKQFIVWRNKYQPGVPILVLAPGSQDKVGYFENVGAYRTAIADAATNTSLGGGEVNNVFFLDASTVFGLAADPAQDDNFQTPERSAGNRLHWSGKAHGLVESSIWNLTSLRNLLLANLKK